MRTGPDDFRALRAALACARVPPRVRWVYAHRPEPGSAEARLYSDFLKPRDWCEA